ncbi:MAG: hypothetical protein QNJ62_06745 [Methyloceanibacter sp.]|nr:hypothetical protein [Methyloceanibacter sp.]
MDTLLTWVVQKGAIGLAVVAALAVGYAYRDWEHHSDLIGHEGMQKLMAEQQRITRDHERRISVMEAIGMGVEE